MKNGRLIVITVLFGLLLVGILAIQVGWVQKVMRLNQKAFDDAVYKSLAAVVKQVEEKENFVFIKNQVETNEQLAKTKKFLKEHAAQAKKYKMHVSDISSNVQISVNSEPGKETKTIVRIEKDNNGTKYVHNSVYVGTAALDSLPAPPVPPTPNTPAFEFITPENKKENVEIILEKMLHVKDLDSVSLQPADIKKLLATQLKQNDLPQKFTFGLFSKDSSKSYIADITAGENKNVVWTPYKVNLYPNDLFGREVTLALMFPVDDTRAKFDMWGAMGLSLTFTVALLILFIYSIRMLIRHKKMLEMKNDFINHMSHEFKTPLAGISLGADMLMSKTGEMDAAQIQKVARTIKKQSTRLTKEVNDVLQNALMEEDIHKPYTLFNLVDVVKTQVELFQPQLEQLQARVHTNFSSGKVLLKGDENQWQKVFSNLLDNSLKFSKENPEINIFVTTSGNKIKIEFRDNGVGIASKDLPRIFDKFFRSNYYNQSNVQGFGLGLNFVRSVVDAHKGNIKVESELNAGTKMIIEVNAEA